MYMTATDDIEKLKTLLLAEAENTPLGRQRKDSRKDSKMGKIRALYPDLLAIKKRLPHATYADLTKMLQNIGLDVKVDSVRKAMQLERAARSATKRTAKGPPIPRTRKTATTAAKSSDVPSVIPTKAKPDKERLLPERPLTTSTASDFHQMEEKL
jgi:hypothetical protein